jgi:hypothetical protein
LRRPNGWQRRFCIWRVTGILIRRRRLAAPTVAKTFFHRRRTQLGGRCLLSARGAVIPDVEKKFLHDLQGPVRHKRDGIVFLTNQRLTLGERETLMPEKISCRSLPHTTACSRCWKSYANGVIADIPRSSVATKQRVLKQ